MSITNFIRRPACVQPSVFLLHHQILLPPPFPSLEELVAEMSLVVAAAAEAATTEMDQQERVPQGRFFQRREHQSISDIYNLMGNSMFWRAFRMTFDSFWRLHTILMPHITLMTVKIKSYEFKGG